MVSVHSCLIYRPYISHVTTSSTSLLTPVILNLIKLVVCQELEDVPCILWQAAQHHERPSTPLQLSA